LIEAPSVERITASLSCESHEAACKILTSYYLSLLTSSSVEQIEWVNALLLGQICSWPSLVAPHRSSFVVHIGLLTHRSPDIACPKRTKPLRSPLYRHPIIILVSRIHPNYLLLLIGNFLLLLLLLLLLTRWLWHRRRLCIGTFLTLLGSGSTSLIGVCLI
jgi:hypothetical protein